MSVDMEIDDEKQRRISKIATDLGIDASLEVLDVKTVLEMFHHYNTQIEALQCVNVSDAWKKEVKAEIEQDVNVAMEMQEKRIEKLEMQLRDANRKAALAEDILCYNSDVMEDITKCLDTLELANARRMGILSGLPTSQNKKNWLEQVAEFFSKELEVCTRLEDTYQIGGNDPRAVVVISDTARQKSSF